MSSSKIVPCLWFDDEAEAAATFYTSVIPGGRIVGTSYFPAEGDNPSGKPPGSVLTVEFEIGGLRLTALNGGSNVPFAKNPSLSFFIETDTVDEVDRIFTALAEGGGVLMELDTYPWSERYGWAMDRFGVSWQVTTGPRVGTFVIPSLLFAGDQQGQAKEAIEYYTEVFSGGRIEAVNLYEAGHAAEGKVSYGRFVIEDATVIAMDSGVPQPFTFNEALSIQVLCEDQAEIDRLWETLSAGGEESQCGWLKDRFGFSWQVVPASMDYWIANPDPAARDRAFRALMQMTKIDIATLDAALLADD